MPGRSLFDTGAGLDSGAGDRVLPIRRVVDEIVARWLRRRSLEAVELVVAHTHSHRDHVFWDREFRGRPRTTVVPPTLFGVRRFFRLPDWPDGQARLDLGGRTLTVFPIPGHESSHIATYDRRTRSLLTGDTLYPDCSPCGTGRPTGAAPPGWRGSPRTRRSPSSSAATSRLPMSRGRPSRWERLTSRTNTHSH